jgi:alginate O-acetyltransferase complex protein AlgI
MYSVTTELTDVTVISDWHGCLFYDAECSLCVAWAERFRRWLRRQKIDVLPLQAPGVAERLALSSQDLLKEMRLLTAAGQVFGGAEAVAQITRLTRWGWPLFVLSRVPGVMPLLACLYRWIAQRRNCIGGSCRRRRLGQWRGWLPLTVLPFIALIFKPALPPWGFMWMMALALFFGCKWLTWWSASGKDRRNELLTSLAYLLAWPGMDAGAFLHKKSVRKKQPLLGGCCSVIWMLFGTWLVWVGVGLVLPKHPVLAGWIGLVGLGFILHFGFFHLLALAWQRAGFDAQPIMRSPILAKSLAEFWAKRWNTAFHHLAHTYAFEPLRRGNGPKMATLFVFIISGLVHELVISLPAGSGYGLPTAYFSLQGFGLVFERTVTGRRFGLGHGLPGWLFSTAVVGGPVFWLFHPSFIHQVILPFLRQIGSF